MEKEFLRKFPHENAAIKHIEKCRWNEKPICPCCNGIKRIQTRKLPGSYRCLSCKKDFSIRKGTIFENSHVTLHKWLYTIYILVNANKKISTTELAKEIDVTQKTAWLMLKKLHKVCGIFN